MKNLILVLAFAAAALVLQACGGGQPAWAVNTANRAAFDFNCPAESIQVVESGAKCSAIARGCGKEAMYLVVPPATMAGGVCCPYGQCTVVLNSDIRTTGY